MKQTQKQFAWQSPTPRDELTAIHWGALLVFSAFVLVDVAGGSLRVALAQTLGDFGSFLASGRAAAGGQNPYGIYPPLTFHVTAPGADLWNPNLNPPISALLFQ